MKKLIIILFSFAVLKVSAQTHDTSIITIHLNKVDISGKLDAAKKPVISTVSGLRALTTLATDVVYQTTDNGGGQWYYDSTDLSSLDNTGTILIANGKRLKRIVQGNYLSQWFGLKGDGSDETIAIDSAIQTVPSGGTLEFEAGKVYNISDKILLTKPINIIGNGARLNLTTANGTAISIRSGNVSIDGLRINGAGNASFVAGADLIVTENSSESFFYDNIKIQNCTLYNDTKGGMTLSYVTNFNVSNDSLYDFPYNGIMILSGKHGVIQNNIINNIHGTGTAESYGLAVSALGIISTDNLSQDIKINGNKINGVPLWEGLDTHGGQNISFTNNNVKNAKIGISIGALATGSINASAQGINVTNNTIVLDSTVSQTQGIRVTGVSTTDLTQAIVSTNQLTVGDIVFTNTANSVIQANIINHPNAGGGIVLWSNEDKISVVGNIVSDVYDATGGGNSAAIRVAASATVNGSISGNILKRTSFTAPAGSGLVNSYGYIEFSTGSNIVFGDNDFSIAGLAQYSGAEQPVKLRGTGSPEGVKTAVVGSTYQRLDGTTGNTFYVKENGTGNTGWTGYLSSGFKDQLGLVWPLRGDTVNNRISDSVINNAISSDSTTYSSKHIDSLMSVAGRGNVTSVGKTDSYGTIVTITNPTVSPVIAVTVDTTKISSKTYVDNGLANKVDKVAGKQLSTNDYTDAEKTKLAGISGTNTGDETLATIESKLGVTGLTDFDPATKVDVTKEKSDSATLQAAINTKATGTGTANGTNTGDQDLSGLTLKTSLPTNGADYGAVPNGITDATTALNNAINSGQNVILQLKDGTYLISSPLTKTSGKLTILGKNVTIKLAPSFPAGGTVYYGALKLSGLTKVDINGITIDGNRANLTNAGTNWTNYIHGISIDQSSNITINNCRVINGASDAFAIFRSTNVLIENSSDSNTMFHGILFDSCTNATAKFNRIKGLGNVGTDNSIGGIGIIASESSYVNILYNVVDSTSDTGIKTEGTNDVVIHGNTVTNSGKDGIKFENLHNQSPQPEITTVYRAKITDNTVSKIFAYRSDGSCLIQSYAGQDVLIQGNILIGGGKTGLEDAIQIDQNTDLTSTNYSKNIKVSHNTIINANRDIYVNRATNVTIENNQAENEVAPLSAYDRVTIANTSHLKFNHNSIKGNSTASVNGTLFSLSSSDNFQVNYNDFSKGANGFFITASGTSNNLDFTHNTVDTTGQYAGTFSFNTSTTAKYVDFSNNKYINFSQTTGLGFAAVRVITDGLTTDKLDLTNTYLYTLNGVNGDQALTVAGAGTVGTTDISNLIYGSSGGGGLYAPTYTVSGQLIKSYNASNFVAGTDYPAPSSTPKITTGTAAPTSTPLKAGDIYIDTTNKKLYFAAGNSSSADWIIAN